MTVALTKEQLIDFNPCGLTYNLVKFGDKKRLTVRQALKAGFSISDLCWVAGKLQLIDQLRLFALECARRVEHLDKSGTAKACNDAVEIYLRESSSDNHDAMIKARRAAYAAYYAAAYAAAYAANSAYDASAAAYAADAAARKEEVKAQEVIFIRIFA